jgi:hypothetical protein
MHGEFTVVAVMTNEGCRVMLLRNHQNREFNILDNFLGGWVRTRYSRIDANSRMILISGVEALYCYDSRLNRKRENA